MDQLGKLMSHDTEKAKIPDLDWLDLSASDVDNIPTPNNVEIIPQLRDAWTHNEQHSTELVPNVVPLATKKASEVSARDVSDLVRQAKRDMMAGVTGGALAAKLSAMYMPDVIAAAKNDLVKLSSEQGLLGNVYIDMTAFDSCADAARALGRDKVRTAKYVVGSPAKNACSSHCTGTCRDMGKKVVASMEYSKDVLDSYTQHLRVAGKIASTAVIESKEALREAFAAKKPVGVEEKAPVESRETSSEKASADLSKAIEKAAAVREKQARQQRFYKVRPILAYMQDQMLKGKIGNALKECLAAKYPMQEIAEYAPEIKRLASLQGLIGNVYVDISYYKNPEDAIQSIRTASTTPMYLVQTVKEKAFDGSLLRVAKATGCSEFPTDGKIDKSVAMSYIADLQFSDKISSETAIKLRSQVEAGSNVLAVIRDTFLATQDHKRKPREGGVQMTLAQGVSKKALDRDILKNNAVKSFEAGVPINKLENKLASMIPTVEAISMCRAVLASLETVKADCLPKCASEKYQFKPNAHIKQAAKCASCIFVSPTACLHLGVKFAGAKDLDKAFFDIDPKTTKVLPDENPDLEREDMHQAYDMKDNFGSGMNVALDNIRKREAQDISIDFNREGLDDNLSTM
jgi:hypothetical protein